MPQINLLEAFKQNIFLLKMMGLWCFENERFYKLFKYFVQSSLVFDSSSLIIYVVLNIRVKNVADTLYSLPGSLEVVLQAVLFRKNFQLIRKSLDNLNQPQFQPRNEEQLEILQDSIALSKKVFLSFFSLVSIMISIWMVIPLTKDGKILPTKYWIPFDYRLPFVYELLYVFECSCIILHAFSNVALDTFFAIAMVQIGAQCDILCNSINNIYEFGTSMKKTERFFFGYIRHYNLIVEYTNFISNSYKEILMVQFMCSSLMICGSMYELSLSEPASSHFFQVLIFQISATNEIFLYCWFANEVTVKSEKLCYSTFQSGWYNFPATLKKNLIIFTSQVQKPIDLYVWRIIPVNIKTFTELLQRCWSFFVAMKNTQELRSL